MIGRRDLLIGGVVVGAASPAQAAAVPAPLRFDVVRDGGVIGDHRVAFHAEGDTLVAIVAVQITVRLGPVVLYRYAHSVREVWRDDHFVSLDSDTNDDGTRHHVHAVRTADRVSIETTSGRTTLAAEAIPLTHWNVLCMARPLFNPQDGALFDYAAVARGEETIAGADGRPLRAAHYTLRGKVPLDDWYDSHRQWVALRTTGRDGSAIAYRRKA